MSAAHGMAWRAQARCVGEGALFFDDACEEQAKRICKTCPVMVECLDHALRLPEPYGVWGGKTAAERWRMARRPKRTEGREPQ